MFSPYVQPPNTAEPKDAKSAKKAKEEFDALQKKYGQVASERDALNAALEDSKKKIRDSSNIIKNLEKEV